MRLKYYMRGIGIGVIFATLVLSISFYFGRTDFSSKEMTDEEIIEKATELGMVMPEDEASEEETQDETSEEDAAAPEEQPTEEAASDSPPSAEPPEFRRCFFA